MDSNLLGSVEKTEGWKETESGFVPALKTREAGLQVIREFRVFCDFIEKRLTSLQGRGEVFLNQTSDEARVRVGKRFDRLLVIFFLKILPRS